VPVRIKGPWAAPKIWPDLEAVVDQNFAEERKKVEAEVNKKVADKLGVTVEEGETVEDAVKKRLDDEINKKLGDLFGKKQTTPEPVAPEPTTAEPSTPPVEN